MKEQTSALFEKFIMGNGRWDLESLKITVAKIEGKRVAEEANMAQG